MAGTTQQYSRRRWPRRLVAASVLLAAVAAGVAAWVARGTVNVLIESDPSGGVVFLDQAWVGVTPQMVRGLAAGPHLVAIRRRGNAPHRGVIEASLLAPSLRQRLEAALLRRPLAYRADLKPAETGILQVDSEPRDAQVYLDGRLVGTTPLRLESVEAGLREVRMVKPGYRPVEARVDVGATPAALKRELPSIIIEVLHRRIQADPDNLHNHVDLAHEYLIRGLHKECLAALVEAFKLVRSGRVRVDADQDQKSDYRFYLECHKIYCRGAEVKYPEEGSEPLREGVMKLMEEAAKAYPGDERVTRLLDSMRKQPRKR